MTRKVLLLLACVATVMSSVGSSSDSVSNESEEIDNVAHNSADTNNSENQNCEAATDNKNNTQDSDKCPGQNEYFDSCISGCSNQTCETIGMIFHCPLQTTVCKTGCRCKPDFYRNASNICVSENECRECGGDPNAHSGCGVNCGKTCSTYKAKNPICPLICKVGGCDCNDGYVFDSNVGKCVMPKECTPTCGLNEQFDSCTNGGCGHKNCSQLGQPEICIKRTPESCTKGCVCVEGYLRAGNGTCVPQDQCPKPGCGGDPNAHSGCGVNCGKTCSTYKAKNPICPLICKVGGCDCNDGYVFDSNVGKCVMPKECTPTCGLNEQFDSCTNGGCGHKNCSQLGQPEICIKRTPESCTKGCVCVEGYLRAGNGTCVPQDQCPKPGCGGDPNAHSGCGVNCGKTCSTYKAKNPICPRICKAGGCDCNDGYVYDSNVGKCVMPKECTPTCGLNEQFDSCTNGGCGHKNCSQLGQPEICIRRTPESCTKGCVCVEGYLRAKNGTCVPQDQCPKPGCGGDPNAHSGCGGNCGNTCSTYKVKNTTICTLICDLDGCDCNEGYVFDSNIKKCVLPEECTPECGLNEQFDSCTNGGCGHRNCSQLGQPELCIDRTPESCIKGCICVQGYLRASNETCVPQDQCPASEGCGGDPNAESGCGYHCGNTCTTYKDKHPNCPRILCKRDGCECKSGYVFDDECNKCVLPEECSKQKLE